VPASYRDSAAYPVDQPEHAAARREQQRREAAKRKGADEKRDTFAGAEPETPDLSPEPEFD